MMITIFDMDGVLLHLPLQTERVREQMRELFATEVSFRPLLQTLQQQLAATPQPLRATKRQRAWSLIDAEELRAAQDCTPLRLDLLQTVSARMPVALYTNNHRRAALLALQRSGIDPGRFFEIRARDGDASIKPSGKIVLEIIAAAPTQPQTVFLLGDHPLDMQSVKLAQGQDPPSHQFEIKGVKIEPLQSTRSVLFQMGLKEYSGEL